MVETLFSNLIEEWGVSKIALVTLIGGCSATVAMTIAANVIPNKEKENYNE